MQRFIEEQNIAHFQQLLSRETKEEARRILRSLLATSQRKLAMIEASTRGTYSHAQVVREQLFSHAAPKMTSCFQREFEAATKPLLLLDPGPGLHIVDANKAYAAAAMIDASKVAGEKIFEVFPDNPDDPAADGVANLFSSLSIVATTGRSHAMAVQRYDVRDLGGLSWSDIGNP